MTRYTQEQKEQFVKKVDELRSSGLNQREACDKVGISPSGYVTFKKKAKPRSKYNTHQTIILDSTPKNILLVKQLLTTALEFLQ